MQNNIDDMNDLYYPYGDDLGPDTNDIIKELGTNFIEYAVAVNTDRAIPDATSGLKPVAKRILWSAFEEGRTFSKPHVKAARIVGDVMGKYHPHGDSSIYGAMVRLSQPWVLRYPLIDWHGSNGNIMGDGPAASRYTEARLSKIAEDGMLQGLKKKNVDFTLNYDETLDEPVTLPAIFPNLLCNPNTGIGVAMACNWLPHNLNEVAQAIYDYIDGKEPMLPGPDFPMGGIIINKDDIPMIMRTGHGSVKVRGKYKVEKNKIIFYEIPFGETIEGILSKIGEVCEAKEIEGIDDAHDETDKNGVKIVITCQKTANPEQVVQLLFAKTPLQSSISYNQVALIDKTPTELNLKQAIEVYVNHNINCIIKESQFDLDKAEARLHIVEGLLKALEDIDNIIALIKKSGSASEAKSALMERYGFTEIQAKAILDMKLSRLAKLEKVEIENEQAELLDTINNLKDLISSKDKQIEELKKRLSAIVKKFGDARRTELVQIDIPKTKAEKEKVEIVPEDVVVVVTKDGYVKRVPKASFKTQSRGGKGVKAADEAMRVMKTNTVDVLMLFSNKGKMYKMSVNKVPEGTNITKGTSLTQFIKTDTDEKIIAASCLHSDSMPKYIIFITKNGMIKKSLLEEYMGDRSNTSGIIALKLKENDSVVTVLFQDKEDIIFATKNGNALRIKTDAIAPIGRNSLGVIGIKLKEGDEVLDALPVHKETDYLAVVCTNGIGKKLELSEIPVQGRASIGVSLAKNPVAGIAMVDDNNNLLICSAVTSICVSAKDLPLLKKAAEGNILTKTTPVKSIGKI